METSKNFENETPMNTFEYKGKTYRLAHEGGIVIQIEKDRLPETLTRVIPTNSLSLLTKMES